MRNYTNFLFSAYKKSHWINGFLLLGFTLALAIIKFQFHELWKDEWQAWLVVRDMNWGEMLGFLYYEGHPALWYIYLKLWTYLVPLLPQDQLIQWAHLLPVAASFAILFFRFSFSLPLKIVLALSYYLFFEYGMVNRGYIFVVLILFSLVVWLKDINKNVFFLAIGLFLLCQTEAYGVLMAAALLLYIILKNHGQDKGAIFSTLFSRTVITSAVGAFLGLVVFLLTILPFGRATEGYERQSELFSQLNGDGIAKAFQGLFANTFWIGSFLDTNAFGVTAFGLLFSLIVLVGLLWLFRKKSPVFYTFIFYTLIYFAFAVTVYTGGVRQWGTYFVFWIACLQLWSYHKPEVKLDQLLIIASICIFQFIYNIRGLEKEIRYPFSNARQAAEYLNENVPPNFPVVAINKFAAAPVGGYSNRAFFALPEGEPFTYFQWLEKIYLPPEQELRLFAEYKRVKGLPILSYQELPKSRYPNLILWEKFDGYNIKQENYYLYYLKLK